MHTSCVVLSRILSGNQEDASVVIAFAKKPEFRSQSPYNVSEHGGPFVIPVSESGNETLQRDFAAAAISMAIGQQMPDWEHSDHLSEPPNTSPGGRAVHLESSQLSRAMDLKRGPACLLSLLQPQEGVSSEARAVDAFA
ncbi:hypothetical protein STEG23_014269 [Scotinomys teguina]